MRGSLVLKWKADDYPQPTGSSICRSSPPEAFDEWWYPLPLNAISMIQFFVLDVLLSRVVAVSTDPAPDSAFAPSFFGRPAGQLPSSHGTMSCVSRQAKIIHPFLSACASPIAWRRG